MARAFDYLPEFDELVERYLSVSIEVYRIEELVCRDLAEFDCRPVLLCFDAVDGLVAVLVKNLEHLGNCLLQTCGQRL